MKSSAVIACAFVLIASAALAGPLEDGAAAYERGDYASALAAWRPLAEQGDQIAQYDLGLLYFYGLGVPQSDADAVHWYRLSADQGYDKAQNNMGYMLANGFGVSADPVDAARWYALAAEQGHAIAQKNLAEFYETGTGVPQDLILAYKWFYLAARMEVPEAIAGLARLEKQMPAADRAEGERLAREWMNARPR